MEGRTREPGFHSEGGPERDVADVLAAVRRIIQPCIQCGTCSGSCPNEFAMDHTPRMLWRLVLSGEVEEIFHSRTFMLCSSCYTCTLRCPRSLPVTDAMAGLKQVAARLYPDRYRSSVEFSRQFMNSVRRHGRVDEMEFMFFYFAGRKNPILPFQFAPLGMRLMSRGKVRIGLPSLSGKSVLDPIFRKVESMESAS